MNTEKGLEKIRGKDQVLQNLMGKGSFFKAKVYSNRKLKILVFLFWVRRKRMEEIIS